MNQNKSLISAVIATLQWRLADGQILFVSDAKKQDSWIQAFAFYHYRGQFYAVTKDMVGVFRRSPHDAASYIDCRAYPLATDHGVIIDRYGAVLASWSDAGWEIVPLEGGSSVYIPSNQESNDCSDNACEKSNENNIEQPKRLPTNFLYQWFRRIFPNKSPDAK